MKNPYTIHEETYRGCTIKLVADESPESPKEWCNVGTMVCWHRRYTLGDEQPKDSPDEYLQSLARRIASNEDARYLDRASDLLWDARYSRHEDRVAHILEKKRQEVLDENLIILPLYLYDHSGISMSTGAFSCPWDSGQVGFIYCTMENAREEWGGKYSPGITDKEIRAKAIAYLQGEVKAYSAYLEGDIVGWVAEDEDGEHIDSCWGYYPDDSQGYAKRWEYPLSEARASIDAYLEKQKALDLDLCQNI